VFQGLLHGDPPGRIDLNQLPEQIQPISIEVLEMVIEIDFLAINELIP
jgi:hypothetical protein